MSIGEITGKEGFVTDTANEFWHFKKRKLVPLWFPV